MYRIIRWFTGAIAIELEGEGILDAIKSLSEEGYGFGNFVPTENGYATVCSVFGADKLISKLEGQGIAVRVTKKRGLPFLAIGFLHRPGLLAGLICALLIIFGSTRLIWDVRPQCDEPFDSEAVTSQLRGLGVYTGAKLYSIDVYEAEQRFLIENSEYSDIAINIQGTVATVKLRKRTNVPHKEQSDTPCNIVASEAGVIQKITATKGEPAVMKGNTVAKGDLLISGEVTGKHGAVYLYPAEGSVTAMVYREYTVIIPLETTEKHYTGNVETKTVYSVLGKDFPLFKNEETSFEYADAEANTEKLHVLGQKLPALKETLTYKEYELRPVKITEEEAKGKAIAAFDAYLEREIDGEVLKKSSRCYYNEELNAVVLSGIAEVATDIGVAVPIKVGGNLKKTY